MWAWDVGALIHRFTRFKDERYCEEMMKVMMDMMIEGSKSKSCQSATVDPLASA